MLKQHQSNQQKTNEPSQISRSYRSGFSVIEIILAGALFVIFSTGIISVILQGFEANRLGSEEIIASQYASEGLEAVHSIRNQSYSNLVATAGTGVSRNASNVWSFTGSNNQFGPNNKYTRVINISSVQRDSSGNIVASGGTVDPSMMKATATVSWQFGPTRNNSVVLSTYLSNWHAPIVWFNAGYLFRKQIIINHTKVSGGANLTSFPVLITLIDPNLKTVANGGSVQNANGFDIIFTDSTQTVKLDHEIEKYVPTTGEIEMWVRIPTLSAAADTIIYMYYDNNSIVSSRENKTGVWDSNYKGVWHLKETNGTQYDSTSNGNNASTVNVTTEGSATGEIDGADKFTESSNNSVIIPNLMGSPASLTLSAWANLTSSPTTGAELISLGNYAAIRLDAGQPGCTYGTYGFYWDSFDWQHTNALGHCFTGTGWHFFAYGFDNTSHTQTLYIDGKQQAQTNLTNPISYSTQGTNTVIGMQGSGSTSFNFSGTIDEARVSNIARSVGWIGTEYNNQSSPLTFYTVGQVEAQ